MGAIDLDKEYQEFLENDIEQAPEEVTKSYNELYGAFEKYLCAIEEHMWKKGFNYAMRKRGNSK